MPNPRVVVHATDQLQLLEVLFAKHSSIGANLGEQDGHYRENAAEMSGSRCALQFIAQRPRVDGYRGSPRTRSIDVVRGWGVEDVDAPPDDTWPRRPPSFAGTSRSPPPAANCVGFTKTLTTTSPIASGVSASHPEQFPVPLSCSAPMVGTNTRRWT